MREQTVNYDKLQYEKESGVEFDELLDAAAIYLRWDYDFISDIETTDIDDALERAVKFAKGER